jgi:hypothetical protein
MNRSFIYSFLFAVFFVSSIAAQVPRQISYQGYIANNAGEPLNGSHALSIKIYSDLGALLHTENFSNVQLDRGIFTVVLGSASTLPASLNFAKKYFLGVTVDGGAEFTPRTGLTSAPYALRAAIADAIAPGANMVTSANGITGAVKIVGGGATTVTQSHDTIFVSSSGGAGGSGIQGVQNNDGTLSIINPNGPVATINLQSVPLSRLATSGASFDQILKFNGSTWTPSAYTVATSARIVGTGIAANPIDLASQGATNGQVLKWSGNAWEPGADNVGNLTLPYSSTTSNSATLFSITNTGTGRAGYFSISNASSTAHVLSAETNTSNVNAAALYGKLTGTNGSGAFLESANPNYAGTMLAIITSGTGRGITVTSPDGANSANVIEASTSGTGKAGYFRILNTSNSSSAIEATSVGTGHTIYSLASHPNASGMYGQHGGSGIGITGWSQDGNGVYGYSMTQIGVRGLHNAVSGTSAGVEGKTNSITAGTTAFGGATGVYGEVTSITPGAWTAGVRGYNKSTGVNGVGVTGLHDGAGYGVYGESAGAGTGVYGKSTGAGFGGYFDIPGGGAGWGVYASTAAKPGGGVWAVFSDRAMKKDIRPFGDGLEVIEKIHPVWYRYNGKGGMPTETEYVGIIAQEMQPIMPYALRQARGVGKSDETYLSFDASALTYIQINAIKELSAKLEKMQERIDQLEQQLREKDGDLDTSVVR